MTESTILDVSTYALLAGDVYKNNDAPNPDGWTRLDMGEKAQNDDNGFFAAAYRNNANPNEIVIAYRGTQEGIDWYSNAQHGRLG